MTNRAAGMNSVVANSSTVRCIAKVDLQDEASSARWTSHRRLLPPTATEFDWG